MAKLGVLGFRPISDVEISSTASSLKLKVIGVWGD